MKKKRIAIIGAGSWGTALAINCTRVDNQQAFLWGHNQQHIRRLQKESENQRYLPGFIFPGNLTVTSEIDCIYDCDAILLVVPSHAFSDILETIAPYFAHQAIAWAIKGFDKKTNDLLSYTFTKRFPQSDYAVIAGPSFAKEVAKGLPTAITVAGNTLDFADDYTQFLHNESMRTYTADDVIGAQLGGALKNVIAIATGISDGLGFGANTRAALITRGLVEINRIGQQAGAQPQTLMGLSGLGDLLLTATDDLSRNRRFGLLLGQGYSVQAALNEIKQTVEGLYTAKEAALYAKAKSVRAPIIDIVEQIISEKLSVNDAMHRLLSHQTKPENA